MEEVRPSVQRGRYGFRAHSGKMAANGNCFPPARTVYDDVFGGPPKYTVPSFPPCVDDYAEIFRGPSPAHKTPPVPFLEPASDCDGEVALVSGDSYADIFGGFACDFTLSLEELLGRSRATAEKKGFRGDSAKKTHHVVDGEKKSLEKVPTRISSTRMGNSDGISTSISENISVASESAHLQLHGMQKPLDMSTEVKNLKSKENSQREMLGSELDAASECTVVVCPDLPSVKTHSTKSSANTSTAPSVTEKVAEIKLANTADSKPMKRTLSNDSKDNSLPKLSRHELKEDDSNARFKPCQLEDGPCLKPHVYPSYIDYGVDKYEPKHAFLSVTEISLQTQPTELPPPSRPPPKLGIKHSDSNKRGAAGKRLGTSTKDFCENGDLLDARKSSRRHHAMAASGTCSAEETSKQSSPRFLDVEVDVNSAAAASAAAMKEVMEEAKAKLKLAKELRERRKNGLKSNKKLADREGKKNKEKEEPHREEQRNKEQEECDSAQEFFECTLEMTSEVSDCEYKECFQEEHKERRPPKEESDYPEKQRCLDQAEQCAKKRLGNGSEFVEESDRNKMKEDTNCYHYYGHKEMVAPILDFELQETESNFVLVQKCTEERARKGTSVVTDSHEQKTNRREHQVEEVRICRVSEKTENAAVEICERKQNQNIGESDHSSYGREDGIRKQIMSEHDTGVMAVQTTQQHEENEKIETDKQYRVGNEEDGKVTATGDIHQQGASSDRLETIVQESMKQEKMNQTKQMAAQEPIGLEETWQREELEEKFASTLDTNEDECSNRLSTSQESTKEDEVHKKNENASQEELLWVDKKKELESSQEESEGNESKEQVTAITEPHEQGGSSDGAREPHEECGGSNRARTPHEQDGSSNRARAPLEQGESSNGAREPHEECGSSNGVREPHEECGSSIGAREPHEECGSSNRASSSHEQGGSSNGAGEPHEECGSSNRARAPHEQGGSSNGAREPHEVCESSNGAREPHEQGGIAHGAARIQQCREPHEQRGSSHGALTTQESREQNEVHENKAKVQQQEEKLMPGDMEREINEKEKVSGTGETHQDSESSNDLKASEESIKQVEMLKNKKVVAQEDVQLQEEKEKQTNVGQDCQGNEQQEELTAGGRNDKRRGRANGLEDVPESRKQEEIEDKPKAAQEAVFQEENINMKADEAAYKHTQSEKSFQILVDRDDIEAKSKRQTAQATPVQEIKEKKVEAAQHVNKLEEKDKVLKMSRKINEIQGIEHKFRKLNDICEKTEKEKCQLEKEKLKRDREKEMERLMKLEEEKEREREREKDRIAVERATRDKSVADAWDKAEKAAVERATAEAREKAPPESKVVDRTSAEGRFRAERSALDKATAEARERAAERAIVEKVAAEARERMERAVAERFAASLRDKPKKDNEREDGMSMRTNGARSTTNEVQNARDASSNETEKRRKARLDRYRRTTERAAKALAEKKARDILAQREQTERNRLAESLDGDVKRWSNGKEGNLRALLSTLQYILGPESGWHPVPLTEIITSAAVKKAYRKATLCVHPDKVQQRGASVQQKYICEKVFDLLKEAWNKFNSEER